MYRITLVSSFSKYTYNLNVYAKYKQNTLWMYKRCVFMNKYCL